MKKTVQKTLNGEEVTRISDVKPIPIAEIIFFPIKYILSTINIQKALFLSSFLTYGVGDGVTAIYMIEKIGAIREINPLIRFMYASSGKEGVISLKIWFSLVVLFLVWFVLRKTGLYWTINGFLTALTIGGIMLMRANMMAAYGMEPPSSGSIITTFLFLMVLLVMIGDLMDKLYSGAK